MSEADPMPEAPFAPLILLDRLPQGVLLEGWRLRVGPSDPDYAKASLRVAELAAQTDPERALSAADEAEARGQDPSRIAAARATALIELARTDLASEQVVRVAPGSMRDLLEARLALLDGRVDEARRLLDALVEDPAGAPDVRADALSFRARLFGDSGREAALADLEALEHLCIEEKANLTGLWVAGLRKAIQSSGFAAFADALSRVDLMRLEQEATDDVFVDPRTLGPVPLELHGVLKKHRGEPERAVESLILLSALNWRIGSQEKAFRIAVLGEKIARGVLGPEHAAVIGQFREVLRQHAGEARWRQLEQSLERAASEFNQ